MNMITDTRRGVVLRAHFDQHSGRMWYCDKDVVSTDDTPLEFVSKLGELPGGPPTEIRVLGLAGNADLIHYLYATFYGQGRETNTKILLGTPEVCSRKDRGNPLAVFHRMEDVDTRRPSVGGWHEVTEEDDIAYKLAGKVARPSADGSWSKDVLDTVKQHPAYLALTFINDLDWLAVAQVLAAIRDPRWYINPAYPDRGSKLKCYLGLTRQNVIKCCLNEGVEGMNYPRAKNAIMAWQKSSPVYQRTGPHSCGAAGDFVKRCYKSFEASDPVKGLLRATNLFVKFIHNNWLARLSSHPEVQRPGEYLFGTEPPWLKKRTFRAFQRHLERCNHNM